MRQNIEITDKFVVKNASLRLGDYIFLFCVLILLYFIIKGQNSEFIVLVFLGLQGFATYWILKRIRDRTDKIIIDKNGIKLCETNDFINWSKIKYAYIKQRTEGVGKRTRAVDYFHIDTKDGEIRVRMSDFSYKKELLVNAVETFSGRNIGELTDLLNDKAKIIIGNDLNIDHISKAFTDFYKRQTNLSSISLFTFIGISIYLQVKIDYPYVFAIGFTLTLVLMYFIGTLEEERFRNQKYICELDDKKYKALKKEYGQGYGFEWSKGKNVVSIIFLIFFVIGVFGVSYMLDEEKNKRENKKIEKINSLPNTQYSE